LALKYGRISGKLAAERIQTQPRAGKGPESLIDEAEEVRAAAYKSGQYSPAVAALREKAVLSGHRIEKSEVGVPGEFESMQDDELERVLIERLGALGLSISPIAEDGETQH